MTATEALRVSDRLNFGDPGVRGEPSEEFAPNSKEELGSIFSTRWGLLLN